MSRSQQTPKAADRVLAGKHESIWIDTTPESQYPQLVKNLAVDVVILGGGLVGINAAALLQERGLSVAVIDAHRIVTGVTGHTTAKITSLHGLIYKHLIDSFGRDGALAYGEANQAAIEMYERLIRERGIECDFMRTSAYTYTTDESSLKQVEEEVRAAEMVGLPVQYVESTPLPFPIKGAVCFSNQAHFHPRKYLLALAEQLGNKGIYFFEETRAVDLKQGDLIEVVTDRGSIRGKYVIIATHFPFHDPAFFFARMYPKRSYVLGVRLNGKAPEGLFYSTSEPYHSIRSHPAGFRDMVLVGGQNHKTGHGGDTVARYKEVEKFARENFDVKAIEYHWSTQDYVSWDRVPFIGKLPTWDRVYVATAFAGWGMTHSMVAAVIIKDAILERSNPWESLYNPSRVKLTGASKFITENVDAVKHLVVGRIFAPDHFRVDDLEKGEGGVIDSKVGKAAVARDGEGTVHSVSPACTHMGCIVSWNNAEESWDCPCHGSRFSAEGKVIHGPALSDLEKKPLET